MVTKKPIAYYIGNFLIIGAISLLIYTYAPLIRAYAPDSLAYQQPPASGIYIRIEKINAQAPIIESVDPWDEKVYRKALKQGVAHAKGTFLPPNQGGSFLFAHSSDAPWNLTRYNSIFLRLGELNNGDEIEIVRDSQAFKYKVFDKKEIWPSETEYLKNIPEDVLILQTCTPIGTDLKRLLVFARK